jgi:hypothetical protein
MMFGLTFAICLPPQNLKEKLVIAKPGREEETAIQPILAIHVIQPLRIPAVLK